MEGERYWKPCVCARVRVYVCVREREWQMMMMMEVGRPRARVARVDSCREEHGDSSTLSYSAPAGYIFFSLINLRDPVENHPGKM